MWPLRITVRLASLVRPLPISVAVSAATLVLCLGSLCLLLLSLVLPAECLGFEFVPVAIEILKPGEEVVSLV